MAVCDEHIICDTLHAWLNLTLSKQRENVNQRINNIVLIHS
jgi:hypothetical protein